MKFFKLNSSNSINVNVFDYKLDFTNIKGSKPEIKVKKFLKPYWIRDLVLEEFFIPGSRLRVDIININKKIAVEVSPSGTHSFNKFFHKNIIAFGDRLRKDLDKQEWCIANGLKYVELGDEELENLTSDMFKKNFEIIL
jgi:hypothetical protein